MTLLSTKSVTSISFVSNPLFADSEYTPESDGCKFVTSNSDKQLSLFSHIFSDFVSNNLPFGPLLKLYNCTQLILF